MKHEAVRMPETANRPFLIYTIGVLGCMPLDVPRQLADIYETEYVSSQEVRSGLVEQQRPSSLRPPEVRAGLITLAVPHLRAGLSVVMDGFFNTERDREAVAEAANRAEAITIGLYAKAPLDVAYERVNRWSHDGSFIIPSPDWEPTPIAVARAMAATFEEPTPIEDITYLFDLDGTQLPAEIIDQFDDHYVNAGFTDRDPEQMAA